MKFDFKRFFLINVGLVFLSIGLHFFLVSSNLAAGGASGFALVISYLIPSINYSILLGIINILLFITAFLVLGKEFGGYTLYSSLAVSGILSILENRFPMTQPITDDLFINLIFGIAISGAGMGIVFNQNASTGGTDIIAKIINKFFHIDMGKSLMIPDFLITLFAAFVFGPKLGMYGLLGVVINSLVIDKIIAGFNVKISMTITSSETAAILKYIIEDLERGATIYTAEGAYTKSEKKIINTVVYRRDYIKIRDFVKDMDPRAFVYISHITEVEGEGFTYD